MTKIKGNVTLNRENAPPCLKLLKGSLKLVVELDNKEHTVLVDLPINYNGISLYKDDILSVNYTFTGIKE